MSHTPTRHPHHQPPSMMPRAPRPIPKFRRLIHQLVERRIHIIGKLDLRDGLHALGRTPDGESHNPLLGQGGVEDSLRPELRGEVHGAAEDAAEGNIFAEEQHALVGAEGCAEGVVDGLEEVHPAR